MPKCIIDGKEVEFKPGENLIETARRAGIEIPYYCYHPGLSVVAQCRMCAIEIEKMPKLQTACSTAAAEGMVIKTKSERVIKNQKSVMEFLLINHPLDCPICDKAGECDLQDQSYQYGSPHMRTTEERRTFIDLDMGPVIKKNMNRCIHCTRCIRFGAEVAGIREMVALQRGNDTEIVTVDMMPLQTAYAGNYADICPTGSLTLKEFRFKKRVWFLKKTPTICEACSRGCNMEVHQDGNVIYRCVPRVNMAVNKYWLCDEGRFNYQYLHDPVRITEPTHRAEKTLQITDWGAAIHSAKYILAGKKNILVLIGSDLTQEEGGLLQQFIPKQWLGAAVFHFGTPGIRATQDDADEDKILRRLSKTANLHGLEKLGFQGFEKIPEGSDAVIVFCGGRAVLPELESLPVIGVGVFNKPAAEKFQVVLPGCGFAEKDGTVINFLGMEQKYKRVIVPPGNSKALSEILMMWEHQNKVAGVA